MYGPDLEGAIAPEADSGSRSMRGGPGGTEAQPENSTAASKGSQTLRFGTMPGKDSLLFTAITARITRPLSARLSRQRRLLLNSRSGDRIRSAGLPALQNHPDHDKENSMEIIVKTDFGLDIGDPFNFRKFSLRAEHPANAAARVAEACAGLAAFEPDNHAWIDAQRLLDWPVLRDDPRWSEGLRAMMEKARPYGWILDNPLRIKAHIDWKA